MTKPAEIAVVADDGGSAAATVERELMFLARTLEAVQRKRAYPLERSEFIILRILAEDGAQGVGRLAKRLLLDDSTMTRQIAALERKGLAARTPDPSDLRVGLIGATDAGAAAMNEMLATRLARVETYLSDWRPPERRAFGRLLARLNAALADSLSEWEPV
jgi:DNA-binding MarR family transcriptional regulator